MNKYPVAVCDGKYPAYKSAFRLSRMGLRRDGNEYKGEFTKFEMRKIERFCRRRHLTFRIDNSYGKRSSNYRDVFFENYPSYFGGKYFCAYCGFLKPASKITVDHLYPVGAVRRNVSLQKRLGRMGITVINHPKNLVAACERCNKSKGKKMGIWIVKGRIGRYPALWVCRWMIRIILFAICVASVMYV